MSLMKNKIISLQLIIAGKGFAWVTLATNDSYSLGALVLGHSLRRAGTPHDLVALVTPGVSAAMRSQLSTVFTVVQEVNVLDSRDTANLALMSRPELGITFTKLHCWRLTQYEKCVFLDADTLVLKNCDELFEREELSAAPDPGWPDCFNSGVFVYRPSQDTYDALIKFAVAKGSFDGGDQGLLNVFFSDWSTKDISKHLPFIYNMVSSATYSYLPAYKQYGEGAKIAHFIGANKPWLQYFDSETRLVRPPQGSEHLQSLLQLWWDIFCSTVHPSLSPEMADSSTFENRAYMPTPTVSHFIFDLFQNFQPMSVYSEYQPISTTPYNEDPSIGFWDPWEHYAEQPSGSAPQHSTLLEYYGSRQQLTAFANDARQSGWKRHKTNNEHVQHSTNKFHNEEHHHQDHHDHHEPHQHYHHHQSQHHSDHNHHEQQHHSDHNHHEQQHHYDHNHHESQHHHQQKPEPYHHHHHQHHEHQLHHPEIQQHQQHHHEHQNQHEHQHHHHHPHEHQHQQHHHHEHHPHEHQHQQHHPHEHQHHHEHQQQQHHHEHQQQQHHHEHQHYQHEHHHEYSQEHKLEHHHYVPQHNNETYNHHEHQEYHNHHQNHHSEHNKQHHDEVPQIEDHGDYHIYNLPPPQWDSDKHKFEEQNHRHPIPQHHSPPSDISSSTNNQYVKVANETECLVTQPHKDVNQSTTENDLGLAGALAQLTLGVPRSAEQTALEEHMRKQAWEHGSMDYMGRDSFDNIWRKIEETLAQAPSKPEAEKPATAEVPPTESVPDSTLPEPKPSKTPTDTSETTGLSSLRFESTSSTQETKAPPLAETVALGQDSVKPMPDIPNTPSVTEATPPTSPPVVPHTAAIADIQALKVDAPPPETPPVGSEPMKLVANTEPLESLKVAEQPKTKQEGTSPETVTDITQEPVPLQPSSEAEGLDSPLLGKTSVGKQNEPPKSVVSSETESSHSPEVPVLTEAAPPSKIPETLTDEAKSATSLHQVSPSTQETSVVTEVKSVAVPQPVSKVEPPAPLASIETSQPTTTKSVPEAKTETLPQPESKIEPVKQQEPTAPLTSIETSQPTTKKSVPEAKTETFPQPVSKIEPVKQQDPSAPLTSIEISQPTTTKPVPEAKTETLPQPVSKIEPVKQQEPTVPLTSIETSKPTSTKSVPESNTETLPQAAEKDKSKSLESTAAVKPKVQSKLEEASKALPKSSGSTPPTTPDAPPSEQAPIPPKRRGHKGGGSAHAAEQGGASKPTSHAQHQQPKGSKPSQKGKK